MVEQLTQTEKDEIYLDACSAFEDTVIDEAEFRKTLVRCGYSATDIEDIVREHRPAP